MRKRTWLKCPECEKGRWVYARSPKRDALIGLCRDCWASTHMDRGERTLNWRGGRRKHSGGYILVYLYSDDFFFQMANKNHLVFEHRLVMAKYLNRHLLSWEIVHHLNGIRDDNRIENLQLLPSRGSHIVDSLAKKRIADLEKRVTLLEAENALLRIGEGIEID